MTPAELRTLARGASGAGEVRVKPHRLSGTKGDFGREGCGKRPSVVREGITPCMGTISMGKNLCLTTTEVFLC
jgi:hypothetical protein